MPEPELGSLKQREEAAGVAEDEATSVEMLGAAVLAEEETPTKTLAASSATARKTSRFDPYPVPLVVSQSIAPHRSGPQLEQVTLRWL